MIPVYGGNGLGLKSVKRFSQEDEQEQIKPIQKILLTKHLDQIDCKSNESVRMRGLDVNSVAPPPAG